MLNKDLPIVWLINGHEHYGMRRAIANLTLQVQRRGYSVIIASLADGQCVVDLTDQGLDVRVLDVPKPAPLAGKLWQKVPGMVHARRYVRQYAPVVAEKLASWSPQVLHWESPNLMPLAPTVANTLGVLPVWEIPNVLGIGSFGLGVRLLARQCRVHDVLVLANSAYTGSVFSNTSIRPITFHLAADEQRFDPHTVDAIPRTDLGIPQDDIVFGMVGRLGRAKGQLLIAEVLNNLRAEQPNLHLVLVGEEADDAFRNELNDFVQLHAAQSWIHRTGFSNEPERYYGLIDVAINAQAHPPEAFGLSVVEAMMMGRPVAVRALGGPAETVIDNQTGWHVHHSSAEDWQSALMRVLADRQRWDEMGQAAREHALANFSCAGQAERYLAHLEEGLARIQRRRS